MTAATLTLNWEALLALLVALLVGGCVAVVWMIHDRRSRHLRVGFFAERDEINNDDDVRPRGDEKPKRVLPPKEDRP